MGFPQTPRELVAEMYLNGWVDVTADVYQRNPITTKRGRGNEHAKAAPSTSSLTLKNTTGNYSPRNPLGAYYGQLGRNVPVRHALRIARDAFADAVVDDWGAADTGQDWDRIGAGGSVLASDWQVTGGKATHSVPATSAYRMSPLDVSMRDAYVRTSVTIPFTDVLGGPVEPANIVLRYQDTDTYYMVRAKIRTDEAVTVEIRRVDGAETVIASAVVVAGVTHTSAQTLHVAGMIEGQTIRGKAWVGATEPYAWTVTAHDDVITAPGKVGVRSGVDSANTNTKPIVFSYEDVEVRRMRFAGEVAKLTPRWDVSHRDKYAQLEAAGILRRLGQGQSPIKSAPRRYITTTTPLPFAYFPLDEGELATSGSPAVGSGQAVIDLTLSGLFFLSPRKFFGQGKLGTWLDRSVAVSEFAFISCQLQGAALASWAADAIVTYDGGINADIEVYYVSSGSDNWSLDLEPNTQEIVIHGPAPFTPITVSESALFDGSAHHVRFSAAQNGANIDVALYIDGTQKTTGVMTNYTLQHPTSFNFSHGGTSKDRRSIGHMALYGDVGFTSVVDAAFAARGHPGETAGRRLERLCAEDGIDFSYVGNLDDTTPMGPQGTKTLLALLRECEDADGGTLYEPRGVVGLAYH